MTMCRRFNGIPTSRVIVTMPDAALAQVGSLLARFPKHPARGSVSEFVRLAVAEKLGRELMLSQVPTAQTAASRPDDFSG